MITVENKRNLLKIPLIFMGIGIIFLWSWGAVSAAGTSQSTIYVSNNGNDSWDGLSSVWNGTSGPKATIGNATSTVSKGGNVYISSGVYNENQIDITNNMTITGSDQSNTVINGMDNGIIFTIEPGVSATISNLTFTNGSSTSFGDILNYGNLTIQNSSFINNSAVIKNTCYGNSAKFVYGNLTVQNCSFIGNSMVIYNDDNCTLSITNSSFIGNDVTDEDDDGDSVITSENGITKVTNSLFENNTGSTGSAILAYGPTILSNCQFDDNVASLYGGALCVSNTTITNCSFTDNNVTSSSYDGYGGGAIYSDGSNTIINCNFTANNALDDYDGGAVYVDGTKTVTTFINDNFINNTSYDGGAILIDITNADIYNSTFTNNTAYEDGFNTGLGGAIMNGYNMLMNNCTLNGNTAYQGGAIATYNPGVSNVSNSTFCNNTATTGGALYNYVGNLNVTSSTITGNTANMGGVVDNEVGITNLSFNTILNNSAEQGPAVYDGSGTVNVTLNWWGSNSDPSGNIYNNDPSTTNVVDDSPWLILTVSNSPTITTNTNITLTADLQHDSQNNYYDPAVNHVPDGTSVTFVPDSYGTINPLNSTLIDGQVYTSFVSWSNLGVSQPGITVDNQTVYANIVISDNMSSIVVEPVSGYINSNVNLTAHLTDSEGNPLAGEIITFYVNGSIVGKGTTNSTGIASMSYKIQNIGTYLISAQFFGDSTYVSSTGNSTLKGNMNPTILKISSVNGSKGSDVDLTANLTDNNKVPLTGKTVTFLVNGSSVGTATTNNLGVATLQYKILSNAGTYIIMAEFNGDSSYVKSNGTGNLIVPDTLPPTVKSSVISGLYNTNKVVSLTTTDPDSTAVTFYTTNGSNPQTSTTRHVYKSSVTISSTTTFEFAAVDIFGKWSQVYTQHFVIDKVPPKVVLTNPKQNSSGFSRTATISIKFSENIAKSSNWSKIYMKNLSTGKTVGISISISGDLINLKTSATRLSNDIYFIYIPSAAVKDLAGNNLVTGYSLKFKTGSK